MKNTNKNIVQICSESGAILHVDNFTEELSAQHHFDKLETIKYPYTYKGFTMNCSEYPENRIGYLRLIVENQHGLFIRRELYRKP